EELAKLLTRPPTPDEMTRARDLFTAAIETPGGLKIQTIHAFCERLLQRFPLEAGVPPGFEILDDGLKRTLLAESIDTVLRNATSAPDQPLGRALTVVVAWAHEDGFATIVQSAITKRDWIERMGQFEAFGAKGFDALALLLRKRLGLAANATRESIDGELATILSPAETQRARDILNEGKKTDNDRAAKLSSSLAATSDAARIDSFNKVFMTKNGSPRANLMTAALKKSYPDVEATLSSAQARFGKLLETRITLAVADATVALVRLSSAILQKFEQLKTARAALDFDDLIRATGSLLRLRPDAQWVLYKLDGGLDHILVDEAQDTSHAQWQVVDALAREFFSGLGAREDETGAARTVFAVGDEKQSIYGFQGAEPKMFAAMGAKLQGMAEASDKRFERIPLSLSFRTVAPVLQAVDTIYADETRAQGLTSSGTYQPHAVDRLGQAGLVEIWETEKPDDTEPAAPWRPLDEVSGSSPQSRLANRIAMTIDRWLKTGERLPSEDRPITAGDILILVRRRRPFANEMVAALKTRSIAVAGADRLHLTQQIVVKDIMALCDFLLLPEDDLSLACVLKSPMFGLDDDDLLALAPGRRGSLWSALLARTRNGEHPKFSPAATLLKRWRTRSDIVPPYEFLVEVLVHNGMRHRLISRLGPDAADPLDELMALALTYDDQAPPSLQGFTDWLKGSEHEIKRDMEHGRNEVRVMTVHGSKGLEAPIVFLPDTCAAPTSNRPGSLLPYPDLATDDNDDPFLWPLKGAGQVEAVDEARRIEQQREIEEYNRLLYVALTRARDQLYIAGYEGTNGPAKGCLYETIAASLSDRCEKTSDAGGHTVWRLSSPQTAPPRQPVKIGETAPASAPLPNWAQRPAPPEAGLSFPLAPSRLAPLETDSEGDPVDTAGATPDHATEPPPAPSPRILSDSNRFLRGTITHALLQYLPNLPRENWEKTAQTFVETRGSTLRPRTRASIVTETLAVLEHPVFAPVFGPGSRAEVPIAAAIPHPDGKSQPLRLAGQLDRIVVSDHEILIVDFKTNRPPPTELEKVAHAYVLQLAAYRLAVSQAFPDRKIRAALLWTDGPNLMEIPPDRLDNAAATLFMRQETSLDA
ncbi:MAG: double-strand break repair helicase AddA, partial [Hyphomicrobiaceae bacterium]